MAQLNVNPTRMELARLKDRLALATRGHDVLKDKQDGLMRSFIELIRENNAYRQEVEGHLKKGMQNFALAKALLHEEYLEQISLVPQYDVTVDVRKENMMSVKVPKMHFSSDDQDDQSLNYGYINSNADLDETLQEFSDVLPKMLKLAELEKTSQLLANEIERTRRRVNALHERTIPDLEETIKTIQMKLDENERAEITRLMKIKDFDQGD
ncbi:V-type ATP synthase subunit D [Aerococcaceae bacterium INB8]|uniref:V-type ATP synthase subunit D n=1 Tax=Ruoffia halotolerans TaxID=2748684 RepID=A0A839A6F8_9LACT|nr:V-type ATP synthase subunit D [Ruoffia halotolerans]MBA5729809.1 V-type ATP synthase subunit D [Ruoffia halotolerans]